MGEAKRRRDAGEPAPRWKRPSIEPPPRDARNLVVSVTITCECAQGGQVTLTAGRINGEWIIEPFDHSFEIDYWLKLPELPRQARSAIN